jgi:hypothetical protein
MRKFLRHKGGVEIPGDRFLQGVGFFVRSIFCAIVLACVGCSYKQEPTTWTLWYIPNEPKPGIRLAPPCSTYVFASAPVPAVYEVAIVRGWTGPRKPDGNTAYMHSGENFSGPLALGSNTVHDESNGYDLNVDAIYRVSTYLAAKARADANCPAPVSPSARSAERS